MFDYIENDQALNQLINRLQTVSWVALDTEFIREKTYYPRLCLIQLATDQYLACIDPLQIRDLSPFFHWLNNTQVTKVFHAASQDLEILYQLSGSIPSPIFDTQIAAAVLGLGDQLGYAKLVEHILTISLDKSQSRTDWSNRPLRQEQLHYAIDDVRYLRQIYPMLIKQLQELKRLHWLEKPFANLSSPRTYEINLRESWMRVKNLQTLKPKQLSMLRELAAWREEKAMEKDIPRRWILSDDVLIDMVRMKIKTAEDFQHIRGLKAELIKRHYETWLQLLKTGAELPTEQWPTIRRRLKLEGDLALIADLLMIIVQHQAARHNISPQMLATRAQIEKMLIEDRQTLSEDWRGGLLNDLFMRFLSGHAKLQIQQQQIAISSTN